MATESTAKTYYGLTKPGIIYGNAISTMAGFFLASRDHVDWILFFAALLGSSLVIASGCVFNNWLDRDIDALMERTKRRASVTGLVDPVSLIAFGTLLGILGMLTLILFTNWLTVLIGLIGIFTYVVVYGFYKRRSEYGTLVGSIAGAVPPVAGYCAVTNSFDAGAIILFCIMAAWQMPHSYAIAIYRLRDYKAAGIPILSITRGLEVTKFHILAYATYFTLLLPLLTVWGYTGYTYLVGALLLGLAWVRLGIRGYRTLETTLWARKMFRFSLVVMTGLSLLIAIGPRLP